MHALLVASKELNMPVRACEIVFYDEEAFSARGTGMALAHARTLGLASYTGTYWIPGFDAYEHRRDFETRYLRETARDDDV